MQHYRNYKCYIPSTGGTRFSNTVVMNPRQCALPEESPVDRLTRTLIDLKHVIKHPHPAMPLLLPGTALGQNLRLLHRLISQAKPKPPVAGARVTLLPGKQNETPATEETNAAPRVTTATRTKTKASPRVLATPERPQPKHNQGRNTRSSTATTILANGTIIRKLFEDNKYYEGEITGYNANDK